MVVAPLILGMASPDLLNAAVELQQGAGQDAQDRAFLVGGVIASTERASTRGAASQRA